MVLNPTPRFTLNGTMIGSSFLTADSRGQKIISGLVDATGQVIGDYRGQKSFGVGIEGTGTFVGDAERTNAWLGTQYFNADGVAGFIGPNKAMPTNRVHDIVCRFRKINYNTGYSHGIFSLAYSSTTFNDSFTSWSTNSGDTRIVYNGNTGNSNSSFSTWPANAYTIFTSSFESGVLNNYKTSTIIKTNSSEGTLNTSSGYAQYTSANYRLYPFRIGAGAVSSAGCRYWDFAYYDQVLTPTEKTTLNNLGVPADFRSLIAKQPIHYYDPSVRRTVGATIYLVDLGTGAPGDGSTDAVLTNGSVVNFVNGVFS